MTKDNPRPQTRLNNPMSSIAPPPSSVNAASHACVLGCGQPALSSMSAICHIAVAVYVPGALGAAASGTVAAGCCGASVVGAEGWVVAGMFVGATVGATTGVSAGA